MAKKTRSRKTKYKKRNPVAALLDGLLTLLDTLLEGVAAAAVAILRGIGKLLLLALRGLLSVPEQALEVVSFTDLRLNTIKIGWKNRGAR